MLTQLGISLPAALVAVALVTTVGTAISRLVSDSMNTQKQVEFRQAGNNLRLSLIRHLSDPQVCQMNFGTGSAGGPVNPATNTPNRDRVLNLNGTSFLEESTVSDATYMNGVLRIAGIDFSTVKGFTPNFVGATKGASDLVVRVQSTLLPGAIELGRSFRPVRLVVEVTGGVIQNCVAVGDDTGNFWQLSPPGDVFFPNPSPGSNFVGIATNNPQARLHINGNFQVSNLPPAVPLPPPSRLDVFSLNNLGGTLRINTDMIADTYLHSSDVRQKSQVTTAPGLKDLQRLDPLKFRWNKDQKTALGLRAQQVQKIFPSAVANDKQTHLKAIDYAQLQGPLIESVKQLSRDQNKMIHQINRYQVRLNELKKTLSSRSKEIDHD